MRIPDNLRSLQDESTGVVILDKLINDLKSKLPLKNKKLEEISTESDIEEEKTDPSRSSGGEPTGVTTITSAKAAGSNSVINKLKSKINGAPKGPEEESDEASDEAAKKKKKISQILQISIAAGAILIFFSDDIFPPDQPEAAPAAAAAKPKRQAPQPEVIAQPETTSATPEAPAETPNSEAPVETANSEGVPSTETQIAAGPSTESEPDATIATEPEVTTQEPLVTETPSTEPAPDPSIETAPPTNSDVTTTENVSDMVTPLPNTSENNTDIISDEATKVSDDSITDQILKDLEGQAKVKKVTERKEYVSPPDYEYKGRGLVYNCTGKHWACVDGPSYKICEDNAASIRYAKKKAECYPFNVYENVRGCENIQYRMISSNAKTNFCNEL